MTHTAKACPGCGESPGYRFRDSEEVCGNCKGLLKRAREIVAAFEKRKDVELRRGPHADYGLPGIYGVRLDPETRGRAKDGNDQLRFALNKLIELAGQRAEQYTDDQVVTADPSSFGHSGKCYYFPKGFSSALDALYEAIRVIANSSYTEGHDAGANLIVGLATGDTTVDQFNEATIGDSIQRQRGRKRHRSAR